MPIEELVKPFETPELKAELATWVAQTEEGKQLLQNYAQAEFEKKRGEVVKELYTNFDKDVFEVLGEEKPKDAKTYEFIKQKLTELKSLKNGDHKKEIEALQAKVKEYEGKGSYNEKWKKEYEALQGVFTQKETEYQNKLQEQEKAFTNMKIESEIKAALSAFQFAEMDEQVKEVFINTQIKTLLSQAKIEEGKVVFVDEKGLTVKDESYKNATIQHMLKNALKPLLANPINKGAKAASVVSTSNGTVLELDTNSFSTQVEFMDVARKALRANSIPANTEEERKILNEAKERYKYNSLKFK